MVILYLGPEGSFSHELCIKIDIKEELVPSKSIRNIFKLVSENKAKGVVPIENTLEGPVNETLDMLAYYENVKIYREYEMDINLVLAKNKSTQNIKRIYSHPHALAEASNFIEKLGIEVIPVSSTSQAASIAQKEIGAAAICSTTAAKLYSLEIIKEHIEDESNATRFIMISNQDDADNGNKTSIIFAIPHRPGSLAKILEIFAEREINLVMIYSRPLRRGRWEYLFYLDFTGSRLNKEVSEALEEVKKKALWLSIKGSYYSTKV